MMNTIFKVKLLIRQAEFSCTYVLIVFSKSFLIIDFVANYNCKERLRDKCLLLYPIKSKQLAEFTKTIT